jgi:hypothetical protein
MKGSRITIYIFSDMNAVKEWYSKALDVEPYFNESFYICINIGRYELGLRPEQKMRTW